MLLFTGRRGGLWRVLFIGSKGATAFASMNTTEEGSILFCLSHFDWGIRRETTIQ
jgi:hypothetical protein